MQLANNSFSPCLIVHPNFELDPDYLDGIRRFGWVISSLGEI